MSIVPLLTLCCTALAPLPWPTARSLLVRPRASPLWVDRDSHDVERQIEALEAEHNQLTTSSLLQDAREAEAKLTELQKSVSELRETVERRAADAHDLPQAAPRIVYSLPQLPKAPLCR